MTSKDATGSGANDNIQPPPPAYQANSQQLNAGPAIVQPQPMALNSLGEHPAVIQCPFCHRVTQTQIEQSDSCVTIVAGVVMGLICICAACLPCMLHWCADVDHFCPACNQRVCHVPYGGMAQPVKPDENVAQEEYVMQEQPRYDEQQQQQQQSGVVSSPPPEGTGSPPPPQQPNAESQGQSSSSQSPRAQPLPSISVSPSPQLPHIDIVRQRPLQGSELDSGPERQDNQGWLASNNAAQNDATKSQAMK